MSSMYSCSAASAKRISSKLLYHCAQESKDKAHGLEAMKFVITFHSPSQNWTKPNAEDGFSQDYPNSGCM